MKLRPKSRPEAEHRINRAIRAPKVRVIDSEGNQLGVMSPFDAIKLAEQAKLDLVEISPNAHPPVCKIIDYGKFRYSQAKRDKEQKKLQHHTKVKEIKLKPNIDEHDLQVKVRRAREFLDKGDKVRLTCQFRGREMAHQDIGMKLLERFCEEVADLGQKEAPLKQMGRILSTVIAPLPKKKK
ncbi:MAG: translation initiation factor IF-3 [Chlamydiales bacterium]|nr:translation initiation factor IF-3 [Chlamydiales bacterium]